MQKFTYNDLFNEFVQIRQEYKNGDFDDLLEFFQNSISRDDFREIVALFTLSGTAYFEALILFIETQIIMKL